MRRLVALAILLALETGCARIRIHRASGILPPPEKTVHKTFHSIVFGAAPLTEPVDLGAQCTYGWESIATGARFPGVLFNTLTANLYGQWSADIACSSPKPKSQED